jgi:hypothetical protein
MYPYDRKGHTVSWWENPKGREHSKDVGVEGRIMLKLILEK